MSAVEPFERLLATLCEAMLDDARWPEVSGLIDEVCGSRGNMLVSGEGGGERRLHLYFVRYCYRGERHEEWEREYFDVWHGQDARVPRLRALPDSRLVYVGDLFLDEHERRSSVVYNEMLPMSHTGDALHARLDGPEGSRIIWTVADPVDRAGWTADRIEAVGRLLPHLRQFVRVRQALVDARGLGASAAALLDNRRCGVVRLDVWGRILVANDRARALLRAGDGIADEGGLLRGSLSAEDARLQKALARALPCFGCQGEASSLALAHPSASPRLAVHVCPVPRRRNPPLGRAGAMVLIVDPLDRVRVDPGLVAATMGLSAAQSRVAVLLAEGLSLCEIASSTGRSYNTVRWHLQQILARLGLTRQVELVRLVLSLSDIPPAGG